MHSTLTHYCVMSLRILGFVFLLGSIVATIALFEKFGVWSLGVLLGGATFWAVLVGFAENITCLQKVLEEIRKKQ